MNKKVKRIVSVITVLMVLFVMVYISTRPLKIDIVTAAPGEIKTWFIEDGKVSVIEDYNIFSTVAGKVTQVFVDKDEYVKAGTVIAQIDTKEYETQIQIRKNNMTGYNTQIANVTTEERNIKDNYQASIAQLKTKLVQAESEIMLNDTKGVSNMLPDEQVTILDLSIEQCRIELAYNKDLFEKHSTLYQAGALSKAEYEASEQNYIATQNKMAQLLQQKESNQQEMKRLAETYKGEGKTVNELNEMARAEKNGAMLDEIKTQISSMENDLAKDYKTNSIQYYQSQMAIEQNTIGTLEDSISDCTIIADKGGYITGLPVSNMSSVYPQSLLCTIKEEKGLAVESYVPTEDTAYIAIGDTVELIRKTREEDLIYTGTVKDIAKWAEEQVSALGVIEHRVKVTIQPNEELGNMASGYDLDVKYFTFDGQDCIVLPNSAFYRSEGVDYVFAVNKDSGKNNGVLKAIAVKKGSSTNAETVVLEGIQPGDIVVKNAVSKEIVEGKKVSW